MKMNNLLWRAIKMLNSLANWQIRRRWPSKLSLLLVSGLNFSLQMPPSAWLSPSALSIGSGACSPLNPLAEAKCLSAVEFPARNPCDTKVHSQAESLSLEIVL